MKIYAALVLLMCTMSAFSQQADTTCEGLIRQANDHARQKEYAAAIGSLQKALAACGATGRSQDMYYNIACYYSLMEDHEKAFQYLGEAIHAGYVNYLHIAGDPDFAALKSKFPEEFFRRVAEAQAAYKEARVLQSPIAITLFDNYVGPSDASDYIWDDFHHPMMDSLRQKYQLLNIVGTGKTEFEKMKLMLAWASTRFTHHESNYCKGRNALAILAEAEKGAQFSCTDYSRLLANCLEALGYPARTIGLTWLGSGFGNPDAHVCTEVWSNQFQKWILLDGQNNAWWEHHGIPLNAAECRNLYVGGRDSEIVFVGQFRDAEYAQWKPYWLSHFYHLELGNSYAFFETKQNATPKYYQLIADGVMPELFSRGMPDSPPLSNDEQEAYPVLNQCNISLRHTNFGSPSDTLNVVLRHSMPWFAKFRIRINGSDWKDSGGTFLWDLQAGENVIEAKAVNAAGIEGKISKIVLRNNIATKQ